MIKKFYLLLTLLCASAHANENSLTKFASLDETTRLHVLLGLSTLPLKNPETAIVPFLTENPQELESRDICEKTLKKILDHQIHGNIENVATSFDKADTDFKTFFSDARLDQIAQQATNSNWPFDKKALYISQASHLIQLHGHALEIADGIAIGIQETHSVDSLASYLVKRLHNPLQESDLLKQKRESLEKRINGPALIPFSQNQFYELGCPLQ